MAADFSSVSVEKQDDGSFLLEGSATVIETVPTNTTFVVEASEPDGTQSETTFRQTGTRERAVPVGTRFKAGSDDQGGTYDISADGRTATLHKGT